MHIYVFTFTSATRNGINEKKNPMFLFSIPIYINILKISITCHTQRLAKLNESSNHFFLLFKRQMPTPDCVCIIEKLTKHTVIK